MKGKLTLLFLAIACGILAMVLSQIYIKTEMNRLKKQYEMIKVVAAVQDLPAGTVLKEDMLAEIDMPKWTYTARNIKQDQLSMILGRKLKNTVLKKAHVLWSDIVDMELGGGTLANMVKEGERAVSIPVDVTSSVTGLVEPNDHVDILGTFTFPSMKGDPQLDTVTLTILQNVTVLATGRDTSGVMNLGMSSGGQRKTSSYSTVTLLVTPKEAEMMVFAMQKGRLTLTLRNPSDVSSARDLTSINFNYLEKKVGEFNEARQERLKGASSR
jgi:pilus assembly protein CpaB